MSKRSFPYGMDRETFRAICTQGKSSFPFPISAGTKPDCAQQNGALDATVDIARQIWNNTTDGSGSAKEKRGVCEWLMLEFPRQVWDRRFADTEKGKEAWGAERVRCGFK